MAGMRLDDVTIIAGYSCPWCPTMIYAVAHDSEALRLFEHHLDVHFETRSMSPAGAA